MRLVAIGLALTCLLAAGLRLRTRPPAFDDSGPAAVVRSGAARVRSVGEKAFHDAKPGDAIRERDLVRAGSGEAELEFADGKRVVLPPGTAILARAPFRSGGAVETSSAPFGVVRGEVKPVNFTASSFATRNAPQADTPPREVPGVLPSPGGRVLLTTAGRSKVLLRWPGPREGTVVVRATGENARRIPFKEASSVTVEVLPPGSAGRLYSWSVLDANERQALGPFTFRVEHFSGDRLKKALKDAGSKGSVDLQD